jgi:hypothetical protein
MKKLFTILFCLLFAGSYAELLKLSDVKEIKQSKLIVGLPEDPELAENFKKMVKEFWSYIPIKEELPIAEALEKAKKDDKIRVLCITNKKSSSLKRGSASSIGGQYKWVSMGLQIEIFQGNAKMVAAQAFPTFGEERSITEEGLAFGLTSLQFTLKYMINLEIKNNLSIEKAYDEVKFKLRKDTLYILEGWLDDDLTAAEISKIYKKKFRIVNYEQWREAILGRKEGVAYVVVAGVPIGGDYSYHHYLVNAKTGNVYDDIYPKAAVSLDLGIKNINLSKQNSGLIKKKNIEKYAEIFKE